jgi:hypothetical protein
VDHDRQAGAVESEQGTNPQISQITQMKIVMETPKQGRDRNLLLESA